MPKHPALAQIAHLPDIAPADVEVLTEAHRIDPATGESWPYYMDGPTVQRYLTGLGLKVSVQTLAHQRAAGVGLPWQYHGQRPIITKPAVDAHLRNGMLSTTSPLVGKRRRETTARKSTPKEDHQ
jgi:hypothetical protein